MRAFFFGLSVFKVTDMPLSDTQPEIILIDENGNYVLVCPGDLISGSGAPPRPFYLIAGVKPDGTACPLQLDETGNLKIKIE